jgi:predicted patatin/cPLA2 family phospholipase
MLSPVTIDGEQWTDGGVRSVTPLGEAIRAGATDIDVIITTDPDMPVSYKSAGAAALPGLAIRSLELMNNQVMRADLKICGLKNDLAGPYKQVNLRVFMPKIDLDTVQDSLSFKPEGIQTLIEMGYQDAKSR